MSLTLEFQFEDVYLGNECTRTVEIRDAQAAPRVGDHVQVDGYREVLNVTHYFGVIVSNGIEDINYFLKESRPDWPRELTGEYQTVYVTLSPRKKHPRERG